MWEVLEVLRRVHQGERRRAIERATRRSRKTITRYVRTAQKLGWDPKAQEPDEELAAGVLARLKPGPKDQSPGEAERLLLEHKQQLKQWLETDQPGGRGLRLTKVLQLLERRGVQVSYPSLHRFCVKHLDFGKHRSTVRLTEVRPGEVAEVDFGKLGLLHDPQLGHKRVVYALVVTLVQSRHQYVHLTHGQKVSDLISGLEAAWEFFGGVTERVIIDNLKAAVLHADRYEPVFQRTFQEYARYRDFVVDAAIARHPQGKPHVERQVPYVRDSFFRGEQFLSLEQAQREAARWCLSVAGERIHGTTRKQPIAEFKQVEQPALKSLREGRFDTPRWAEVKIHDDYHVRLEHALYSVPHQYRTPACRDKKVTIRKDSKLVRIYCEGKLIKTHPVQPKGGRSTDYQDYPSVKSAYAMRDIHGVVAKAQQLGPHIGEYAQRLLDGNYPWARFRQAQLLLRLVEKHGEVCVERACQRALAYDLINAKRLRDIIEKNLESERLEETEPSPSGDQQLPLRFLRDSKSFNHGAIKEQLHGA